VFVCAGSRDVAEEKQDNPPEKLLIEAPKPRHADGAPQNSPKRPRKVGRKWIWMGAILVVLLAIFLVFRIHSTEAKAKEAAAAKPQGASITSGQSTTGDINIYVDALGTVTPIYTVTVYSQITGRVMSVHYTEGQLVKENDPLVDIDPTPYQAMLTQAQGNLLHDQGVLEQAQIDLKRYQDAWARNAIAKQQLDDQVEAVKQDEGAVKADEGTVAYDQVQLGYCHIVAPISGRVGLRLVDPGNTVFSGSGSTLVVITQLQPITIVFNVSEDDLPQVQEQLKGGRVLEVDAYNRANDKEIEKGKLTSLDNQVDTTTGTVKFRATFPNKDLSLFPNQFVNARLLLKTLKKVTLVPTAAVQHNGTTPFVYLIQSNNTVSVQQVTVLTSNENVTALSGLNPGTNMATSGFDRLENGVAVTVRNSASK
jgi:membrane fusion protein, multidrug efflux system